MTFYLVQRGTFRDKIDISKITGIDSIISWDYMGSSEFEFGALPTSLKRIVFNYRNNNFIVSIFVINNKQFKVIVFQKYSFINSMKIVDSIHNLFYEYLEHPYGDGKYRLKEILSFDHYFEGKEHLELKEGCIKKQEKVPTFGYCDFWWDISNDWWVFPEENKNDKLVHIALNKLKEINFDKLLNSKKE